MKIYFGHCIHPSYDGDWEREKKLTKKYNIKEEKLKTLAFGHCRNDKNRLFLIYYDTDLSSKCNFWILVEEFGFFKLQNDFILPTIERPSYTLYRKYYTNNGCYNINCYIVDENKIYISIDTPSLISWKPHMTKDEIIEKTECESINKSFYVYHSGKCEEIKFSSLSERYEFELKLINQK